jgi:hypothetical protein
VAGLSFMGYNGLPESEKHTAPSGRISFCTIVLLLFCLQLMVISNKITQIMKKLQRVELLMDIWY